MRTAHIPLRVVKNAVFVNEAVFADEPRQATAAVSKALESLWIKLWIQFNTSSFLQSSPRRDSGHPDFSIFWKSSAGALWVADRTAQAEAEARPGWATLYFTQVKTCSIFQPRTGKQLSHVPRKRKGIYLFSTWLVTATSCKAFCGLLGAP